MRKLLLASIIGFSLIATYSCKEGVDNSGKTTILHDSMANVLPNWQSLKIKVSDEQDEMLIVVGDVSLYKASPEERLRKVDEVGTMVLRIYGKENQLRKGQLIVTKDARNESWEPADGILTPIDFESLKK